MSGAVADRADPSLAYLDQLAGHLGAEVRTLTTDLALDPARAEEVVRLAGAVPAATDFDTALATYRRARNLLATMLDDGYALAAAYRDMDEFWADAARQETGDSLATYWDSYEHGLRRRLEGTLAATYGCEQAVLVNTGMSAIDVALRSLRLPPGSRLLVHERAYFETSDYLQEVLAPTGVAAVPVDLTDAATITASVATHQPDAILLETVLNGPACDIPALSTALSCGIPLVLDISTVGHGVPEGLRGSTTAPLIAVESGAKYLTRQASSGVLYGWSEAITAARLTARRTGQQLTGRALHRLRVGEILTSARRISLHAERTAQFVEVLGSLPALTVTSAASVPAAGDALREQLGKSAPGSLCYVRLPVAERDADQAHRECVSRWQELVGGRRIRAGFGWTATTARSYGRDALNTAAGQAFVRVSVGIEPAPVVRELATAFVRACRDVLERTR
ncbi:PLP-dependent transferase [Micromonospora sp. NPDC023644]|uniref:PLP-dependent transferase n=1 Tax=Micromonospora sp. NPDC023644 TaxID=3154321 RepID=UPI0033CE83BD